MLFVSITVSHVNCVCLNTARVQNSLNQITVYRHCWVGWACYKCEPAHKEPPWLFPTLHGGWSFVCLPACLSFCLSLCLALFLSLIYLPSIYLVIMYLLLSCNYLFISLSSLSLIYLTYNLSHLYHLLFTHQVSFIYLRSYNMSSIFYQSSVISHLSYTFLSAYHLYWFIYNILHML